MRRTLTVLAASAALLVPATAASAASGSNASCNNGKGGNGAVWNGAGNAYSKKFVASGDSDCGTPGVRDPKPPKPSDCTVDPWGQEICPTV